MATPTPFTSVYDPVPTSPATPITKNVGRMGPPKEESSGAVIPSSTKEVLQTELQPYGVKLSKYRTAQPRDVLQDISLNQQRLAEANAEVKKAELESQAQLLGEQAAETKRQAQQMRDDISSHERKLSTFSSPEFHPTKENAQSLGELFSLISTAGIMLGGAGKLASINALNAMGGMLKGWQAGRADLFKREKEIFDKEFQRMKTIREDLQRTFAEYQKVKLVDNQAAMYKLQELASKAGASSIISAQINAGKIDAVGKTLDAQLNISQKEREVQDRLAADAARRKFDAAEKEKDRVHAEKLATDKFFRELGSAGIRKAIYDATGKVIDQKGAAAVQSTSSALREITDLRDRLKDPEIRTGLQSLPAPFITKLKSLVGREEAEIGDFINTELTGNDKTTLFIKDAILASFKVEQGLTGTRVPVFTQKVVGPILDPRSYSPEVYDKLLSTRQNQLFGTAADYGFSQEDMSKIARLPVEAAGVAPAAAPKVANKADIAATAKANGITEEEAKSRLKAKGFKIEGE